jgi:hypothetical protein
MHSHRTHHPDPVTLNRPVKQRPCDCPGCNQTGSFRAPRSRERLNDYYWFCLDHVRDYNATWDYLKGLSADEIEARIRDATVWERPTWPLGEAFRRERTLFDKLKRAFFSDGPDTEEFSAEASAPVAVGEKEALAVLDLQPPVDFKKIKARYRLLVKKHHPDANGGSRAAEEKIKIINHAFTALKKMYDSGERNQ